MSFDYKVNFTSNGLVTDQVGSTLVYDLQQALGLWSNNISGLGTLSVDLTIIDTPVGRADASSTSSYYLGKGADGRNLFMSSSEYTLLTGFHVPNTTSDISVRVSPSYLNTQFDLSPNLTFDSEVSLNHFNPIMVFLHEIGHGLGITGFRNPSTGALLPDAASVYDKFITIDGNNAYFTGSNTVAANGGPLQVTSSSFTQNWYHFGNDLSDAKVPAASVTHPLTLDLMNGIVFYYNQKYPISNIDLGVMSDLGYLVGTNLPAANPDYSIKVAVAVTEQITGLTPLQNDFLVRANFAQQQYNYYSTVLKVAQPQLGPYEALGRAFGETIQFKSTYSADVDATTDKFVNHAYLDVFHTAPSAAAQSGLVDQVTYFTNLFQSVGISASSSQLQARGAVVGQMIGYAMTDPLIAARPNMLLDDHVATFLNKVATGTASYGYSAAVASISDVPLLGLSDTHSADVLV